MKEGERWDFQQWRGEMPFSRCKGIGRMAYILAEIVEHSVVHRKLT